MYNFLLEVDLLNPNQSVFCPSNSCVNHLLATTHEIFEAFDCNPPLEVKYVFLDISKTFHKVWQEGLLYKLKSMSISADFYNLKRINVILETSFSRCAPEDRFLVHFPFLFILMTYRTI